MKIIILGSPGSGKGTYAQLLEPKFTRLSTGDLLRDYPKNTELGKKINSILKKGDLVPDNIVIKIIKSKIDSKSIIFDGFPRTLEQAKALDKITKIDKVILLTISNKEAISRLFGRLQCIKCGRTYHIKNNSPKKRGICDFCKGVLYKRTDEDAIKHRLLIYNKTIKPIIKYYQEKNILFKVDANQSIKKVFSDIEKLLNNKKKKNI